MWKNLAKIKQEICANAHETRENLLRFMFANCQSISQPFRCDFAGVPQFDALVRWFPWTWKIETWTVEIYVQCWKFQMQLVRVYLNWFQRNSLLKCVLQPEIAKNP